MTRRSPHFRLLVAILSAVGLHQAHAAPVDQLRYRRPVAVDASGGEDLVAVRVDAEVAAATESGFPDLRVIDGAGQEVSRILRRASVVKMRSVRRSFPVHQPRLKPLPGGGLEIELTIDPEKHPHSINGFRIETPLRNFEQRVQVHRLDEAGAWEPIGSDTLLFDYSQYMDTRQVDVPLPREQRSPAGGTWRITVDEPTIEQQSALSEVVRTLEGNAETSRKEKTIVARQPFRIDSIEAWHVEDAAEIGVADGVERPIVEFRVEEQPEEKRTRVRVTSDRQPTTSLRLSVADRNFGRPARVEAPPPATRNREAGSRPPQVLGSARMHRIDLRGINSEELAITIPESRFPDFEIVIDNADSQPLEITGVTALGPAYEVVFLARPGNAYRLAYGAESAIDQPFAAPQYDTVAIDAALAAGKLPLEATLGAAEEVAVVPVERPWLARLLGNPWLIGGTILLLAVLLGFSLFSAAKRLDGGP
jgi:hypothetical protein